MITRSVICILLCLLSLSAFAYSPDAINGDERLLWETMTGREAGQELLKFRFAGDPAGFAARFVLFLNQGRSTSDILAMLRVIGLPLKTREISALEDIYLDTPEEVSVHNISENGYSLECHATPDTRFSLVFVNEVERAAFRKWREVGYESLSEHDKKVYANLEGRLCVWALKRKIHLGGPRLTFERAKPIMIYADAELD